MYGTRTTIYLRNKTRTYADGGWSDEWSSVQTIKTAIVQGFRSSEKLMLARDASIQLKKCYIPYSDVREANRQYLTAAYRIMIGTTDYDIESVETRGGIDKHYEVILKDIE